MQHHRPAGTLGLEVVRELVGDSPYERLILLASVPFLAEDPSEAAKQVVTAMQVGPVVRVADDALQDL